MKALGIVRKIDELGRVVVPKEIRRINGWEAGTDIEMYSSADGLVLREYKSDLEKQALLNELYEVFHNTENEEVFNIIGRAIDFVKKG